MSREDPATRLDNQGNWMAARSPATVAADRLSQGCTIVTDAGAGLRAGGGGEICIQPSDAFLRNRITLGR